MYFERGNKLIEHKGWKKGRWCFCGTGQEDTWYRIGSNHPNGEGNRVARLMTMKYKNSTHTIFCSSDLFGKGRLKSKHGKQTIRCQDDKDAKTMLITTIVSGSDTLFWWTRNDERKLSSLTRCTAGHPEIQLRRATDPRYQTNQNTQKTLLRYHERLDLPSATVDSVCTEKTQPRDRREAKKGRQRTNWTRTHAHGLQSIEVQVPSKLHQGQCSWVVVSRGLLTQIMDMDNTDLDNVNRPIPDRETLSHSLAVGDQWRTVW